MQREVRVEVVAKYPTFRTAYAVSDQGWVLLNDGADCRDVMGLLFDAIEPGDRLTCQVNERNFAISARRGWD